MSKMKTVRLTAIGAVLVFFIAPISAQSSVAGSPSEKLAAKKTRQIGEKVNNVNNDQLTKILVVEQAWAAAREDFQKSGSEDAIYKTKKLELRTERDAKIKNILSVEQYIQYETMLKWERTGYNQKQDNK